MNHRLLAGLMTLYAAACGGASSTSPTPTPATTPTPAAAPSQAGSDQPCGYDIIGSAKDQGGACLEPEVLGADTTTRCEAFLQRNGWKRDGVAESAIGQRTDKTVVCFRAPSTGDQQPNNR
jgi:hypothetical protein